MLSAYWLVAMTSSKIQIDGSLPKNWLTGKVLHILNVLLKFQVDTLCDVQVMATQTL